MDNKTLTEMLAYAGHKATRASIAQQLIDAAALLLATCEGSDCAEGQCSHCAQAVEYVRNEVMAAEKSLVTEWRHARGVVITLPTVPTANSFFLPEMVRRQRPSKMAGERVGTIEV